MADRDFDSRDGGYIRVMNEFVDKLITYRLDQSEWQVVMLVIRSSWGIQGRPWTELRWRDMLAATRLSNSSMGRAVKKLKARNLLHTLENRKQITRYKINSKVSTWSDLTPTNGSKSLPRTGEITPTSGSKSLPRTGVITPTNGSNHSHERERSLPRVGVTPYKDNIKTIERHDVSISQNPQKIINQAISHLNQKLGTTFDPDLYITQSLMIDRIGEGAGLDDFKAVIDKKYSQWCYDVRMVGNLRPVTLFAADKFEGYLQEARRNGNKPKQNRKIQGIELMGLGLDVLTQFGNDKFIEFCDYNNLTQNDIDSIRHRAEPKH